MNSEAGITLGEENMTKVQTKSQDESRQSENTKNSTEYQIAEDQLKNKKPFIFIQSNQRPLQASSKLQNKVDIQLSLRELLSRQDYGFSRKDLQQAINFIINLQFDKLNDYLQLQLVKNLVEQIKKMPWYQQLSNRSSLEPRTKQLVISKIIEELNLKGKLKETCSKLLTNGDLAQLKEKLNNDRYQKLLLIIKSYPQLEITLEQTNTLLEICNQQMLSSQGTDEAKVIQLINYLVDLLLPSSNKERKQQSNKWNKLSFQQQLSNFQSLCQTELTGVSFSLRSSLNMILKSCTLAFYIVQQNTITHEINTQENKNNDQQLRNVVRKLQDKISIMSSDQQFKSRLAEYKATRRQEHTSQPNRFQKGEACSLDQFIQIKKEEINEITCLQYLLCQKVYFHFEYNHQIYQFRLARNGLRQKIHDITKLNLDNLIFFTSNKQHPEKNTPCDLEELQFTQDFKVLKKQATAVNFRGKRHQIQISKDLAIGQLNCLVVDTLNKKQRLQLSHERSRLNLKFQNKALAQFPLNQTVYKLEEDQSGPLVEMQLELMTEITLYYGDEDSRFDYWQKDLVLQLKNKIMDKYQIPVQSQILQIETDKVVSQLLNKQSLHQRKIFDQRMQATLITKGSLEFYGFHQNISLKSEEFKQFFIENEKGRIDYISNCEFNKANEKIFMQKLLPYIYSAFKKRLELESVIRMFRQQVSQYYGQEIWTSTKGHNTFNPTFLLYYILYNSEPKLRVEIMNLVKHSMPLPLYFKQFSSIMHIENTFVVNEQLMWILKDEVNIVSVGLHNESTLKSEKGKSDFLNRVFYTNIVTSSTRHGICQDCSEISLSVYGSYFPANLVDISSKTPPEISDKILRSANFVLLHSWKSPEQTQNQVKRIKSLSHQDVFVITIMRDLEMSTNDNWIGKTKQFKDVIQIYNLSCNQDPVFVSLLIKRIKKLIHMKIQQQIIDKRQVSTSPTLVETNNKTFLQFQNLLKPLENALSQFKIVSNMVEDHQNTNTNKREYQTKLQRDRCGPSLNLMIQNVLKYIAHNMNDCNMLMDRLKDRLKEYKDSAEQKYKIIIYAKKDIDGITNQKSKQYTDKLDQYLPKIFSLPRIHKFSTQTRATVLLGLSQAFSEYQNNIKPQFVSIELLWRQLYKLVEINPHYTLGDKLLIDFIVSIQRRQIFNGQPFQLLDGDSLKMPKTIIKKILESVKGTAATIIILGPQSSGKSTLLNYLFGCDFKTSEGRCTRGVYGTYYNISNNFMCSCSSIFLVDTKGLLSITNKKDQVVRADFDSKLILFCLAVADFVIVNTKSDLDSETMGKLKACKRLLPTLSQGSNPEFWLIMNQNQSSDLTNKANDVNRLQQLFDMGNSRCLSQAFDTTSIGKQQICILKQDLIIKKKSKNDFERLTIKLQDDLIQSVSTKPYKCIPQIIDKMEVIWSTIQKYPDLGKFVNNK